MRNLEWWDGWRILAKGRRNNEFVRLGFASARTKIVYCMWCYSSVLLFVLQLGLLWFGDEFTTLVSLVTLILFIPFQSTLCVDNGNCYGCKYHNFNLSCKRSAFLMSMLKIGVALYSIISQLCIWHCYFVSFVCSIKPALWKEADISEAYISAENGDFC